MQDIQIHMIRYLVSKLDSYDANKYQLVGMTMTAIQYVK